MTLKRWPAMFGVRIVKTASSFSLLFLLAAFGWGIDYAKLRSELDDAKSVQAQVKVVQSWPDLSEDEDLREAAEHVDESYGVEDLKENIDYVRQLLDARVLAGETLGTTGARSKAASIKSNPLYHDPGIQEQSNWLDGAIRSLLNLLPKFENNRRIPQLAGGGAAWIIPVMWALLGTAVLVFGYFAFRHFSWKRGAKRRAKAVLEEDEPERTLDEWLLLADKLASEGRYREAVRALYLSCLLKFDEHGVARFLRGETNWEHLARISASPRKPADLDFLEPTKAFDRIWYGHHVRGAADIDQFRAWYAQITDILTGVKAA